MSGGGGAGPLSRDNLRSLVSFGGLGAYANNYVHNLYIFISIHVFFMQ